MLAFYGLVFLVGSLLFFQAKSGIRRGSKTSFALALGSFAFVFLVQLVYLLVILLFLNAGLQNGSNDSFQVHIDRSSITIFCIVLAVNFLVIFLTFFFGSICIKNHVHLRALLNDVKKSDVKRLTEPLYSEKDIQGSPNESFHTQSSLSSAAREY